MQLLNLVLDTPVGKLRHVFRWRWIHVRSLLSSHQFSPRLLDPLRVIKSFSIDRSRQKKIYARASSSRCSGTTGWILERAFDLISSTQTLCRPNGPPDPHVVRSLCNCGRFISCGRGCTWHRAQPLNLLLLSFLLFRDILAHDLTDCRATCRR